MGKVAATLDKELVKLISETAIEHYKKEQVAAIKKEQDRRLYNVKLLLKKYRLINATTGKIAESKERKQLEAFLLSLDLGEVVLPRTQKSKELTLDIATYLNRTLEFYKVWCEREGEQAQMRYTCVDAIYLRDERKTVQQVAFDLCVDKSTVYEYLNAAYNDLGVFLFGIDYLKVN